MKITSLEKMEAIVASNKSLSWDGWDVVELVRSPVAWSKPNAAFIKGFWYYRNVFAVNHDGWSIPTKYVR
jgi:hypothetical protein